MANTKSLSRKERKSAKRKARHELQKMYRNLTSSQRTEFQKSEKSLKSFVKDLQAKASNDEE